MTKTELLHDSGATGAALAQVGQYRPESRISTALSVVLSRWGTTSAAMQGDSMYQDSDSVVMSFPVNIPGQPSLIVNSVPLSDVLGKADDASVVSLVTVLAVSVGLALLAAVGLKLAMRPLQQLRTDMAEVACMRLDGCHNVARSRMREIRSMQVSFVSMVQNLTEYKQYLPQSVLVATDTEDDSRKSSQEMSQTVSHGSSPSLSRDTPTSYLHDAVNAPLKPRNVTLMVTNIRGFIPLSRTDAPGLASLHSVYLEHAMLVVNSYQGIVDEFIGDKVHASFNTLRNSSTHRISAVESMAELLGTAKGTEDHPLDLNAAVVSGRALCGNMGCKGLKKYTIVGQCAALVWTYERWGKAWGVAQALDGVVAKDCAVQFEMRKVANVQLTPSRAGCMFEMMKRRNISNEEWMYQLGSCDRGEYVTYNKALDSLYDTNMDQAAELVKDLADTEHAPLLNQRLRACKARGEPLKPVPANYVPSIHTNFSSSDYALLQDASGRDE
eukprot:TRINITY_DN8060_c1_g1_i1.p1 TRINITY_DN8060_c1_g1~~TRINITY_DN8060_c1_g1_i1.p1  ORF type:complete len:498 (+),score=114.35 TRINITY_DN8060_c1_g1_i1:1203-2696(+)